MNSLWPLFQLNFFALTLSHWISLVDHSFASSLIQRECTDLGTHRWRGIHLQPWLIKLMKKLVTVDFVLLYSDVDFLGSKLINALTFPHEHNFKLLSLRVVVDELCKFLISWVSFNWNIYCYSLFKINNIVFKSFNFNFWVLELFQEFQWSFVSFISFVFLFK